MSFDYTTAEELKQYVDSLGSADEDLLRDVVTATSRAIDVWCGQAFSAETYAGEVLPGIIDVDGILHCWPAVPVLDFPTVAEYRFLPVQSWASLPLDSIDKQEAPSGSVLRFLGYNFFGMRGRRVQVRLTFLGGYATRAALPDDFVWAVRLACAAEYKAREAAGGNSMGGPGFGGGTPKDWPEPVRRALSPYRRELPI
jgi:hypothetical protein